MSLAALWYLNRATGVVSLLLFTLVAVLGLLLGGRPPAGPAARTFGIGLHRIAGLLAVSFLVAHVGVAVLDNYVDIGVVSAVVPFTSGWRPMAVGLGTVAFDLTLAIIATSLLRARLDPRAWKLVHWSAYAALPLAVLHALTAGTDLGSGLLRWITLGCAAAVVGAAGWRWSRAKRPEIPAAIGTAYDDGRRRATRTPARTR